MNEMQIIWDALHDYREQCISTDDALWDDICTQMAQVEDKLVWAEEDDRREGWIVIQGGKA